MVVSLEEAARRQGLQICAQTTDLGPEVKPDRGPQGYEASPGSFSRAAGSNPYILLAHCRPTTAPLMDGSMTSGRMSAAGSIVTMYTQGWMSWYENSR